MNAVAALLRNMKSAEGDMHRLEREVGSLFTKTRLLNAGLTVNGGKIVNSGGPALLPTGRGAYSRAIEEQARLYDLLPKADKAFGIQTELEKADGASGSLIDMAIESLFRGWPGYVSASVSDLVEFSAESVPDITLRPEMLLAPSCFLLLGRPMLIESTDVQRGTTHETVRAISWTTYGPESTVGKYDRQGVFLIFWIELNADEPMLQALRLFPMCVTSWLFGDTRTESLNLAQTPEDRWCLDMGSKWFAAFTSFCSQHLIQAETLPPERAVRRRLERENRRLSDILVIELRRAQHDTQSKAASKREWSCSWVVRGHWRQQACGPGWQDRKAIWIDPYPKGPDDKEFRINPQRVFAVVK